MPRPNRKWKAVFMALCIALLCIGTSGASLGAEGSVPKGFLAGPSESQMSWTDAKNYCASRGGRLPRISNAASLTLKQVSKGKPVDAFGTLWGKWPAGLPDDAAYWTDTEALDYPGSSFVVGISESGRKIAWGVTEHGLNSRVVCVPVGPSNKAPASK
jgi:hypothetical protein